MTLEKAQRAVEKAEVYRARAREALIKAVIIEAGAKPWKVRKVELNGFLCLFRTIQGRSNA